jgi:hypothetical protein
VTVDSIFGDALLLDSDERPPTPFSLLVNGGLDDNGFSLDLEDVPGLPGMYVFATTEPFGRLRGASDILYIGRSGESERGKLRGRIAEYVPVTRKLRRTPKKGAELKIAKYFDENPDITLGWLTCASEEDAKELEKELLMRYAGDPRRDSAVQQPTRSYPPDRLVNPVGAVLSTKTWPSRSSRTPARGTPSRAGGVGACSGSDSAAGRALAGWGARFD